MAIGNSSRDQLTPAIHKSIHIEATMSFVVMNLFCATSFDVTIEIVTIAIRNCYFAIFTDDYLFTTTLGTVSYDSYHSSSFPLIFACNSSIVIGSGARNNARVIIRLCDSHNLQYTDRSLIIDSKYEEEDIRFAIIL